MKLHELQGLAQNVLKCTNFNVKFEIFGSLLQSIIQVVAREPIPSLNQLLTFHYESHGFLEYEHYVNNSVGTKLTVPARFGFGTSSLCSRQSARLELRLHRLPSCRWTVSITYSVAESILQNVDFVT